MRSIKLSILLLLLFLGMPIAAEPSVEKGLAIAVEMDRRDTGFADSASTMEMVLKNRKGDVSTRKLRNRVLEQEEGNKSIFVFDDPLDVKGAALLTFSYKTKNDDQWLYLPALKRTKRISSSNQSGPFMGSEFAYEDMASQEVEKYSYSYLQDEELDGMPVFVLARYPVDQKSGYTRQLLWVDKDEYRPWKIEYYDRKRTLLKTLTFADYQQYLAKYWRPHQMEMINHQTGKSTLLKWDDFQFKNGYTEKDFSLNSLTNIR
ncbi:MAG: outer membrane lipoprotein-sorting protein [Pseudomonadales bacterium]